MQQTECSIPKIYTVGLHGVSDILKKAYITSLLRKIKRNCTNVEIIGLTELSDYWLKSSLFYCVMDKNLPTYLPTFLPTYLPLLNNPELQHNQLYVSHGAASFFCPMCIPQHCILKILKQKSHSSRNTNRWHRRR